MGVFQRFENRLEQAVSGAFAKAFRSAVQPVELAAALQREVDNSAQVLSRNRRLAPNTFTVELSAVDYDRLHPYEQTLASELGVLLGEHAQDQGYVFAGPVAITFTEEDELSTGRFRVTSQANASVSAPSRAPSPAPAVKAPVGTPATRAPSRIAVLLVGGQTHPLRPPGLVVGRGNEADLRIEDLGISRRHAEFRVVADPVSGDPQVTVVDLGSTNGTLLNGRRIERQELGDGARVKMGNTEVTLELRSGGW